uniref:Uncharacterized protein n=1 Tax=Aplanochytrium stocchinoi TaxID=215587 RepID=A0A7S3PNC3_9STRA
MASVTIFHNGDEIFRLERQVPIGSVDVDGDETNQQTVVPEMKDQTESDSDRYTYEYTGKHDHGKLPGLKSGDPKLNNLLHFLKLVKEESSKALAGLVQEEKKKNHNDKSATKKPRLS